MINDTLASDSRMIVMTQPKQKAGIVYNIGCAGKIISFEETLDKRYLITLLDCSAILLASSLTVIDSGILIFLFIILYLMI